MTSISARAVVFIAVPALLAGVVLPLLLLHARGAHVTPAGAAPAAVGAGEVDGAAVVRRSPRPQLRRRQADVQVFAPPRTAVAVRQAVPRPVAPRVASTPRAHRPRASHPPRITAPPPRHPAPKHAQRQSAPKHAQRPRAPHGAKVHGPKPHPHGPPSHAHGGGGAHVRPHDAAHPAHGGGPPPGKGKKR